MDHQQVAKPGEVKDEQSNQNHTDGSCRDHRPMVARVVVLPRWGQRSSDGAAYLRAAADTLGSPNATEVHVSHTSFNARVKCSSGSLSRQSAREAGATSA